MILCECFGGAWIVAVCIILYNIQLENPWAGFKSTKRTYAFTDDSLAQSSKFKA